MAYQDTQQPKIGQVHDSAANCTDLQGNASNAIPSIPWLKPYLRYVSSKAHNQVLLEDCT